jgi:hypothetical protein
MLGNFHGKRMAVAPDGLANYRHGRAKPTNRGALGQQIAR